MRAPGTSGALQQAELDLVGQLNRKHFEARPHDTALAARIKSFETAFHMQQAAPEAFDELWHLVRPADESRDWAIAGIQQNTPAADAGKPSDAADARRMLGELAGKTHRVLTAVALGTDRKCEQILSESRVTFAPMSAAQIAAYVASGEPMGKAGAYAVQGRAAAYIDHISGSYSGIMGLPMFETAQLLREFGFKV